MTAAAPSLMGRVAGAPITWGVCEVPGWGHQLAADRVLDEMAAIGLGATELGPEGYLPTDASALRDLLERHGFQLVGGFLPIALRVEHGLEDRLAEAGSYAALLAAAGARVLVLAAAIDGAGYEASAELDAEEWARLVRGVDRVAGIAADHGLTVAVHPHHGTAVERSVDVERFLETSTVPLCLDSGHLVVGGADPLAIAKSTPERVAHVHLKDVDAEWAERVRAGRSTYMEAVRGGMYRPLGDGDLDIAAIVRSLEGSGYGGWYVLEQDTVLETAPMEGAGPVRDASASVEFLRRVAAELDRDDPAGWAGRARTARDAASPEWEEGL